jgi:hypothetical protein
LKKQGQDYDQLRLQTELLHQPLVDR